MVRCPDPPNEVSCKVPKSVKNTTWVTKRQAQLTAVPRTCSFVSRPMVGWAARGGPLLLHRWLRNGNFPELLHELTPRCFIDGWAMWIYRHNNAWCEASPINDWSMREMIYWSGLQFSLWQFCKCKPFEITILWDYNRSSIEKLDWNSTILNRIEGSLLNRVEALLNRVETLMNWVETLMNWVEALMNWVKRSWNHQIKTKSDKMGC